jgi:CheY-like chemotaxis protein
LTIAAIAPAARGFAVEVEEMNRMPDDGTALRVLVIDDNVDGAEMLSLLLQSIGCRTAVAHDGRSGVDVASAFNPHLAFIDLEMPEMDGCAVVRLLHAKHPNRRARLICLTGKGQPEDEHLCLEAGFDAFLTKPIKAVALSGAIEDAWNAVRCGLGPPDSQ